MKYKPVKSSQIKEIAYDAENQIIWVRFKNKPNKPYSYGPFTQKEFDEFLDAVSVGKHFYPHIRPKQLDLVTCEGCEKQFDVTIMHNEPEDALWICPKCVK